MGVAGEDDGLVKQRNLDRNRGEGLILRVSEGKKMNVVCCEGCETCDPKGTRMRSAFELVTPERFDETRTWRDTIDAVVTGAELKEKGVTLEEVVELVLFMTATSAKVTLLTPKGCPVPVYRLTAKGYRAGPAGP